MQHSELRADLAARAACRARDFLADATTAHLGGVYDDVLNGAA
jgi:hypothetical protein